MVGHDPLLSIVISSSLPRNNEFHRMHWAVKHKTVDRWFKIVWSAWLQAGSRRFSADECPVFVRLIRVLGPRQREYDDSNLFGICDKLVMDALVKCGLFPDDSPRFVRMLTPEHRKGKAPALVVEVYRHG